VAGRLHSGPRLSISENGSFDNPQLNFVSNFVILQAVKVASILLAAKVTSMLQKCAWGESA
jgi:hypothetical protein